MKTIFGIRHGDFMSLEEARAEHHYSRPQIVSSTNEIELELSRGGIKRIIIYHGPKGRALGTAEIVRDSLGIEATLIERQELDEESKDASNLVREISDHYAIFVSHEPCLIDLQKDLRIQSQGIGKGEYIRIEIE